MISIAGRECADQLAADFRRKQEEMRATGLFFLGPREASALQMLSAGSDAEWLEKWMKILPLRAGVGLHSFPDSAGRGLRGRIMQRVRSFLWRVLRYQHERVVYRQNLVNAHIVTALAFQHEQMARENAELRSRIEHVEALSRHQHAS